MSKFSKINLSGGHRGIYRSRNVDTCALLASLATVIVFVCFEHFFHKSRHTKLMRVEPVERVSKYKMASTDAHLVGVDELVESDEGEIAFGRYETRTATETAKLLR